MYIAKIRIKPNYSPISGGGLRVPVGVAVDGGAVVGGAVAQ